MRSLSLAFATVSLLAAPRLAGASSCPINSPLVESYEVPLGCPVVVHMRASASAVFTPQLITTRAGVDVDITGAVDQRDELIPILFYEHDAECHETAYVRDEAFLRYEIQLANAQIGDTVAVPSIEVVAAGPCPGPNPPNNYGCSDFGLCVPPDGDGDGIPDSAEDPDGGCSAGSGGSFGLAAGLLALVIGRRRSRVRS